ncbi:MAG: crossover junction endodeoxyribonuclease RuvC [Planctomycetes bacterium]|nr:crossover junction endodeoxyribonuclease RuvC [Planctomycetota bacterium]
MSIMARGASAWVSGTALRIAGIDPGTRVVGYCVLEARGPRLSALEIGTIRARGRSMPERLHDIGRRLDEVFGRLRPGVVAIERAYVGRNPASALALGLARGVAMVCATRFGARVTEVAPSEAKKAVAAGGGASKGRVQRMVQLLLGLAAPLSPDAADAVALALCQAGRRD